MRYRKLGRTALDVSAIGFGASPLGNVFGVVDAEAAARAVGTAVDHGINLFDVSPYYGLTLAEERLGQALAPQRRNVFVGTKCGRYGSDVFDFSAKRIMSEFEESLRRLRTDYVDILQAHDIEFGDIGQILQETIPAMHKLREQGKVRYLGVTGYWPGLLARVASETDVDCVLNYCHANLFVDDMDAELVPFVKQSGIGLLNASPLHMGLLTDKPIPPWHPAPECVVEAAEAIRRACKEFGVDTGTVALSVCLDHPAVASTLVGISSEAELVAACAALQARPPKELMLAIRRIVDPVRNIVWPSGLEGNSDALATTRRTRDVAH
jgi:L-galactose dehydrogenase